MGARPFDDDRPTVDLGPQNLEDPTEILESEADDADVDPTTSHHGALPANGTPATVETDEPGTLQQDYPGKPVDPVHQLPTQQLPQKLAKRGGTSVTRLSESRTTTSPVEAMRIDEIERTRVFLRVAFLLSIGGAIIALLTGGDVIAQRVVVGGSAIGALGAAWILL
ncbi:MAG: hypothetical protein JNL83_09710, partial [Myxococcales bacterium]|nr:hypothetical protein [Myxococcales bacterium]